MPIARDNGLDYSRAVIDSKLGLLSKEASAVIRHVGDSGGGLYIIDYEKALEVMAMQNIESAIREKFAKNGNEISTKGDRGVRVFRLLRQNGYLEEEQIEKKVMLSSKEAKEVSYELLDNNFITTRQIAKTNDFAPARTFYLYGINVPQLLGTMVDFTSQALRNVIRRRMHEAKRYEALTERQIKMETIIANIEADANLDEESKKHQALEVENVYLTAADKSQLKKHKEGQVALWKAEVQLERLLFLYQQYQAFHRSSSLQKQIAGKPKRRAKNLMEEFQ
ncbi:Protein C48E7.2 [Aphelenchoides avenae]|nr:Protein C48E7.2 [Aphelenchus avenae]